MASFIDELKQRRVPGILAVYLGTAWVCIEALNFFIEKYNWNSNLFQAVLNLLLAAIPSAIIYAWIHGKAGRQYFGKGEVALYFLNGIFALFLFYRGWESESVATRITNNTDEEKSIAVLPFENLSNDPKQEFVAEGIAEDIISRISQIASFKVISRTSSFQYKNTSKTIPEIGKELRVGNILEGSTRWSGDTMRISVKLVNARTDESLWAETFDRKVNETFKVQSEVASRIASALQIRLTNSERSRIAEAPAFDIEAYDYYQKGMSLLRQNGTEDVLNSALSNFNRALNVDSSFFLAYVGIARTYIEFSSWGRASASSVLPQARKAIQHALELNNRSGKVYEVLASIALNYDADYPSFESYARRALELEPNHAAMHYRLAQYYSFIGEFEKAKESIDKAIELDPLYERYKVDKALIFYVNGHKEEAIRDLEAVRAESPDDNFAIWTEGLVYLSERDYQKSILLFRSRTLAGTTNWALGLAYGLSGDKAAAEKIFDYQMEKAKIQYVPPAILGYGYYCKGNYSKALDLLEEQVTNHDGGLEWLLIIRSIPVDALQKEPRFRKLMKRKVS